MTTETTPKPVPNLKPEPRSLPGIASEVITAFLVGVGLIVFVVCLYGMASYGGWYRLYFGAGVLVGLLMMFRFSRDDLNWAGYIAGAWVTDVQNIVLKQQVKRLNAELKQAQRPILVTKSAKDTSFVQPASPDTAWEDARFLLTLTTGRRLPGRPSSRLSQDRQQAALATLARANVLRRVGNNYDLTCEVDEATSRLIEAGHHQVNPSSSVNEASSNS